MKLKTKFKAGLLSLLLFLPGTLPLFSQTLLGSAAGDFFSAFAKLGINEKRYTSLEDLKPYMSEKVFGRLEESLVYRVGFIGYAANQLGVMTGITSSVGFAETLNALTGFLMVIEENGELQEWTIKEITNRYEQLLASSWRNVNPSLFIVILEAYCSYKRGELWK